MLSTIAHSFNRQSSIVNRQLLTLVLLLLLLIPACSRLKAPAARKQAQLFAEILKRENRPWTGKDKFLEIHLLTNSSSEVRQWCALALGRIADPKALTLLYEAIRVGDAPLRAVSAFAIGEIEDRGRLAACNLAPDPRAIVELRRLLGDTSLSVRMRAIEALGRSGSSTEVPEISRQLERYVNTGSPADRAFLNAAIIALARLGDSAAAPSIERLARADDPDIKQQAADALTRLQAKMPGSSFTENQDATATFTCRTSGAEANFQEFSSITESSAYALAAFRKNSTIAQIETSRGPIEIELFRTDAPVTSESFVLMAVRGIYNGTELKKDPQRQLIEAGDPVGYAGLQLQRAINREVNMRPFERGSFGLAMTSGKSDVGRFFIANAPQPYLDGINTCFGRVISGMQVVDRLISGDRILRINIKETVSFHDYQRFGG